MEFHKVVPLVLAEVGCIEYAPTIDAQTDLEVQRPMGADVVTVVEKWESIAALKTVYDPEIPVNIFEMGLIYDVLVDTNGQVGVKMTLTAPACPAAQSLPVEVRDKARSVEGVTDAEERITELA